MFEYYSNIHALCPRVGADETLGSNFFRIINIQSFTLNDILKVFPIQMRGRPMLTLP